MVFPGLQPLVGAHEVVVHGIVDGWGVGGQINVGAPQFPDRSVGAQLSHVLGIPSPPETCADSSGESRRTVVLLILIAICFSESHFV